LQEIFWIKGSMQAAKEVCPLTSKSLLLLFFRKEGLPSYNPPQSAAVSAIRLENPHSLSYHPTTRTSAPPSTLAVCVASKVQDAATPLKSLLTKGAVL
jgi:hypothetical protein